MKELKDYIAKWNENEGKKEVNNKEFIANFIGFIKSKGKDHFEFNGDNDYCGHTAIVYDDNPKYCYHGTMAFEFAYSATFVKVFNANHNGFWVPEFIDLQGGDAAPILAMLHEKFTQWGGFSV